jgi:hypothetical protein
MFRGNAIYIVYIITNNAVAGYDEPLPEAIRLASGNVEVDV